MVPQEAEEEETVVAMDEAVEKARHLLLQRTAAILHSGPRCCLDEHGWSKGGGGHTTLGAAAGVKERGSSEFGFSHAPDRDPGGSPHAKMRDGGCSHATRLGYRRPFSAVFGAALSSYHPHAPPREFPRSISTFSRPRAMHNP